MPFQSCYSLRYLTRIRVANPRSLFSALSTLSALSTDQKPDRVFELDGGVSLVEVRADWALLVRKHVLHRHFLTRLCISCVVKDGLAIGSGALLEVVTPLSDVKGRHKQKHNLQAIQIFEMTDS